MDLISISELCKKHTGGISSFYHWLKKHSDKYYHEEREIKYKKKMKKNKKGEQKEIVTFKKSICMKEEEFLSLLDAYNKILKRG